MVFEVQGFCWGNQVVQVMYHDETGLEDSQRIRNRPRMLKEVILLPTPGFVRRSTWVFLGNAQTRPMGLPYMPIG